MPNYDARLDVLVSVIKTLQERIQRDHATIGSNETRTRNALIDPLFRALGWNDSSVITSEYLIRYGSGAADYVVADYALHAPGQRAHPIAFIEAKRMREDLSDEHRNQALKYASRRNSVEYAGLTNGDRWEFYEIFEDGYSPILNISIRDESAFDCAVQLLSFKRRTEGIEDVEDFGSKGDLEATEETAQTYYHDLGVEPSASPEDLSQAYRPEIRQVHPDVSADENANEKTKRISKVLSWSGLATVFCGIVGYVIGFRAAQPVLEGLFGAVGAIAVGIVMIGAAVLLLPRLPWKRLCWLWSVGGDVRTTLIWSCGGIVVGGVLGSILGYAAGFRTAQLIYDMLAVVGIIAVIGAVVLIGIGIGLRGRSQRRS